MNKFIEELDKELDMERIQMYSEVVKDKELLRVVLRPQNALEYRLASNVQKYITDLYMFKEAIIEGDIKQGSIEENSYLGLIKDLIIKAPSAEIIGYDEIIQNLYRDNALDNLDVQSKLIADQMILLSSKSKEKINYLFLSLNLDFGNATHKSIFTTYYNVAIDIINKSGIIQMLDKLSNVKFDGESVVEFELFTKAFHNEVTSRLNDYDYDDMYQKTVTI